MWVLRAIAIAALVTIAVVLISQFAIARYRGNQREMANRSKVTLLHEGAEDSIEKQSLGEILMWTFGIAVLIAVICLIP